METGIQQSQTDSPQDLALAAMVWAALSGLFTLFNPLISLVPSAIWLAFVIRAFARNSGRARWTLVGLPFALYGPYIVVAIYYACAFRHDCI